MRTITHNIQMDIGEILHLTPIGDIHEDALAHDKRAFQQMLDRRSRLDNSYFISLGDLGEFIGPGDHRDIGSIKRLGKTAWVDAEVERMAERYAPYNILAIGEGNHEHKATTKYGTNPAERLAEKLGVPFGGYAYRLFLRLHDKSNNKGARATVRINVHHGAWGGDVSAGFGGAMRWARGYPGYDIFLYGHNHASMHRMWTKEEANTSGYIYKGPQCVVACGTFMRTAIEEETTYSEKAGYGPVFIGCPLISVKLRGHGIEMEVANGNIR